MCEPKFMAIHHSFQDIHSEPPNLNLKAVLEGKLGDHHSHYDSSSGDHEYLYKILWQ